MYVFMYVCVCMYVCMYVLVCVYTCILLRVVPKASTMCLVPLLCSFLPPTSLLF